ncbi:MAG: murein biosynthesis integral membrane protein MurJ [Xanthomonadales bacterium]|nr:murein biosynthesis integral membrane protein MurJ [Xanthomonadales bacterium]
MRLLRSTVAFSAMTLLSRLAGFARDVLQAALFGANAATDAFTVAYRVPNFLRRIFAEGSFAMAFVPAFAARRARGDRAALRDFLDHVAGALIAGVVAATLAGILLAPGIVALIAPGTLADPERFALTVEMLRLVFPYLALIALVALAGGVLNSHGRFALPAFAPVLHNLALIAAMLLLAERLAVPAKALAWGVLLAGLLQLLLLWPALRPLGLLPRPRLALGHPGLREVLSRMGPTVFAASVAQLNLIAGTACASLLAVGAQSWLWYADRLLELPLGLFGVALGTVMLPRLAEGHATARGEDFRATLLWGIRGCLLLALPAAAGLFVLAEPLVTAVYQRAAFGPEDARMTAAALAALALGLPGFMLSKVLLPAFYARGDTRRPMRTAVATVLANLLLLALLVPLLLLGGSAAPHAGIAAATAGAGTLQAALLWRALARQGLIDPRSARQALLRPAAAALLMALALELALAFLPPAGALGEAGRWLLVGTLVAGGALLYALALLALGWRPRELAR